jgi:hypothetical protein
LKTVQGLRPVAIAMPSTYDGIQTLASRLLELLLTPSVF